MCGVCGCGDVHAQQSVDNSFSLLRYPHTRSKSRYDLRESKLQKVEILAPGSQPDDHHQHPHQNNGNPGRLLQIEEDILADNNHYAAANRARLQSRQIFCVNFLSSPGSGKTTLLVKTINLLKNKYPIAVIEGDQQTSNDAEKIRGTGVPALQINTGKGCHLEAQQVGRAMEHLPLQGNGFLLIENVGNLVCPAAFDLGETKKVVVFSVTEGEDKPIKYPDMFSVADIVVINKCDLLPYLEFDLTLCLATLRRVNAMAPIFQVSASTGVGMDRWVEYLESTRKSVFNTNALNTSVINTSTSVLDRQGND